LAKAYFHPLGTLMFLELFTHNSPANKARELFIASEDAESRLASI